MRRPKQRTKGRVAGQPGNGSWWNYELSVSICLSVFTISTAPFIPAVCVYQSRRWIPILRGEYRCSCLANVVKRSTNNCNLSVSGGVQPCTTIVWSMTCTKGWQLTRSCSTCTRPVLRPRKREPFSTPASDMESTGLSPQYCVL